MTTQKKPRIKSDYTLAAQLAQELEAVNKRQAELSYNYGKRSMELAARYSKLRESVTPAVLAKAEGLMGLASQDAKPQAVDGA